MFRLRKRDDYITPRTTVKQLDFEGIICNSRVVLDSYVNEIVTDIDDSAAAGKNWDYLPS